MVKFAIFILFIVANLSFAEESPNPAPSTGEESQPEETSTTDENQEAKTKNTPTENSSSPINLITTPDTSQVKNDPSNTPRQPPSDSRIFWVTVGLFFVGLTQVFVYAVQARYMRQGLGITQQAADAATKSADAAKQSADITNLTLKSGERAYLSSRRWQMVNFREGSKAQATCSFANVGKTPGWITAIYCNSYLCEQEPNILDYRQVTRTYAGKRIAIHPKEERHLPIDAPSLGPDESAVMRDGKKRLYFYACIVYEDIFKREWPEIFFVWYDPQSGQFNEIYDAKYYQSKQETT